VTLGYKFVPFPDSVARRRRDEACHDRVIDGTISGALRCVWTTEQPVHVGSGFKGLVGGVVVREAARVRNRPGIPGSSLRGALRSRFEAITRSCAPKPPREQRGLRSTSFPAWTAEVAHSAIKLPVFTDCRDDVLCPACALFGKMSLRSRVAVEDLGVANDTTNFSIDRMPSQFSPNLHHVGVPTPDHGKRVVHVDRLHGRKFAVHPAPLIERPELQAVEAIPTKTGLVGEIRVVNLRPHELGGLLVALGQTAPGTFDAVKLGGGKCHGFGRMRLQSLAFAARRGPPHPLASDPRVDEWLAAFRADADRFEAGERRLLEIHRGDC